MTTSNSNLPWLIVAATQWELKFISKRLSSKEYIKLNNQTVIQGILGSQPVLLLVIGVGSGKIRKKINSVLNKVEIKGLVLIGFCGALKQELKLGDSVLPEVVEDDNKENSYKVESTDWNSWNQLLETIKFVKTGGVMVSVNHPADVDQKKQMVESDSYRVAVDMEALEVAKVISNYKVPWIVFKVVSDEIDWPIGNLTDNFQSWFSLNEKHPEFLEHPFSIGLSRQSDYLEKILSTQ